MLGFAATRMLTGMLGLFVPIVLARNMALQAYADYALLLSAVMLLVIIGSLGYDRGAFRFIPALQAAGQIFPALRLAAELVLLRVVASVCLAIGIVSFGGQAPIVGAAISTVSPELFVAIVAIIATTEGLTVTASALALHRIVASIGLLILLGRTSAFAGLVLNDEALTLDRVLSVTLWTESFQGLVMGLATLSVLRKHRGAKSQRLTDPSSRSGIDRGTLLKCCISAWGAYLTSLPTQGPALRLLVGVFADTPTVAAFAFFQQLADRAKVFLPLQLVVPNIETTLSARRLTHARGDASGLQALTVMTRINLLVVSAAFVALIAAGPEIEHLLTADRFKQYLPIAALLVMQLMPSSIESALWTAYNAAGDAILLNRASMFASILAFPIVVAAAALAGATGVAAFAGIRVVILAIVLFHQEDGEPARSLLTCPRGAHSISIVLISLGMTFWSVLAFQQTGLDGLPSLLLGWIVFGGLTLWFDFAQLGELQAIVLLVNARRTRRF